MLGQSLFCSIFAKHQLFESMKRSNLLLLAASLFAFTACSSGGGNADAESTEETTMEEAVEMDTDYTGMVEVDLNEYGVMASLMVPGDDKGRLEVSETSWGSIEVRVGEKFGMEIVPFGLSLEEGKAELDQGGVYTIEVLEENESMILYKRTIPNAEVKDEVHFFMTHTIDGEIYELKTMADMELKEAHVREIMKSAMSMKAKPAV